MDVVHLTKFNPGIYPTAQVSFKHQGITRADKQIETINYLRKQDTDNLFTGFWLLNTWKDLDNNPYLLEKLLDDALQHDQYITMKIIDRWFKDITPPIPKSVMTLGTQFKSNTSSGMIWDLEYVEAQLRFMEKISFLNDHPALQQICWGETSIKHSNSAQQYTNNLKELYIGSKKQFPNTLVGVNINFLGDTNVYLEQLKDTVRYYGGGDLENPDTIAGHRKGYTGPHPLYLYNPKRPYYIKAYDILEATTDIAKASHIETWSMYSDQVHESLELAIDTFGCTHVQVQTSFDSRHDTDIPRKEYVEDHLYPALQKLTDTQLNKMKRIPDRINYRPNGYNIIKEIPKVEEPPILIELPEPEPKEPIKETIINKIVASFREWLTNLLK